MGSRGHELRSPPPVLKNIYMCMYFYFYIYICINKAYIYIHRNIYLCFRSGWQQPELQHPPAPAQHPRCTKVFSPRSGLQPSAGGIAHPAARKGRYLFAVTFCCFCWSPAVFARRCGATRSGWDASSVPLIRPIFAAPLPLSSVEALFRHLPGGVRVDFTASR